MQHLRFSLFLSILPLFLAACAGQHAPSDISLHSEPRAALFDPQQSFWSEQAPELFQARFETTAGNFVVEAHREWAPRGVDRFYNLVRSGFFDNSRFFRVDVRYIAQFGIAGDPAIAKIWRHESFPDDPPKQSNTRGTIGYAMTGPDTRTTQLYINLTDNSRNDSQGFAPIGKVVSGMDVADKLYSGYGENSGGGMRAGRQDRLFEGGNVWLDRDFPKLDHLVRATIVVSIDSGK